MTNPHFVERNTCPVCGAGDARTLFSCAFTEPPIRTLLEKRYAPRGSMDFGLLEGAEYVLHECKSCSLIYQRDIPDEYLSEIAYEVWTDPDRSWAHRSAGLVRAKGRYGLEVMSIIDFLRRPPESLRFLDYGMGWGFWVEMARAFGVDSYGFEPAGSRVSRAKELSLKVVDADELRNLSFDFVNTEQVFEHLPDPYATICQLVEVLGDGGILKISVPNGMRVKRRLKKGDWLAPPGSRRSLNDVFPFQHLNAFNHRAILRLADRVGLEPVPIPARLRYRYMPTWERSRRLLKRTVGAHYRALRHQSTVVWLRRPNDHAPARERRVASADHP